MADDDTETQVAPAPAPALSGVPPDVLNRLIQQLTTQQAPPPVTGTASTREGRGWVSLLGEALGGGQQYGTTEEREQGGLAALGAAGARMLQASDWSYQPHTLGSIIGQGLTASRQSLGQTQAVSAARQTAAQDYQHQQQTDQLERIKAALPLLTLQGQIQRAQAAAKLAGAGTPGATPSTSIAGGSLSPFIATNLPDGVSPAEDQMVRTVIGEAANQGTVGQQAVAAVIKNRMDAGGQNAQDVIFAPNQFEPWNNPKTRAGLEAIDPTSKQYQDILNNAVRPVMAGTAKDPTGGATHFYSPTAQKALGRNVPDWAAGQTPTVIGQHNFYKLPYASQAPAPGQTAAAPGQVTPPAPPGTNPNAKVLIPPPATPPVAGARPTLPQPEAPLAPGAGGAQVAGPGGPTSGAIPPSPPGSAADVADIRAGMVGAGADPTTLAPGPGSMPSGPRVMVAGSGTPETPPPTAPTTAPVLLPDLKVGEVTTQHPGPFATYHAKEYVPPPQTENFNPNLTPQERAAYDMQRQQIGLMNPADQPKAYADLTAALRAATEAKAQRAATAVTAYDTAQRAAIQTRYDEAVKNYNTVAGELQKQANNRQTAERAAEIDAQKSELTSRISMRDGLIKKMNDQSESSADAVKQLQIFRELSNAAGTPSLLPQGARDWLVARGIATPEQTQQWSAQSALNAANNHLIGIMRNGTGFSRTTNMDLEFLTHSMPGNADQSQEYRNAKTAFLISAFSHQQKYADLVSAHVSDGMKLGDARAAADKALGPIIRQAPFGLAPEDAIKWRFDNLENGQFYKNEAGRLVIFNPKNAPRPE